MLGQLDSARAPLAEALVIRRRLYGDDHPDVATSLVDLADAMPLNPGDTVATSLLREALAIRQRHFGGDDPRTVDALYALAARSHMSGDRAGARALLDAWMAAVARAPAQLTPARAEQLGDMAILLQLGGRVREGERLLRAALDIDRALYGDHHQRVGHDLVSLGAIYEDEGRHGDAERTLRDAIEVLRASHPGGHPELANATSATCWTTRCAGPRPRERGARPRICTAVSTARATSTR